MTTGSEILTTGLDNFPAAGARPSPSAPRRGPSRTSSAPQRTCSATPVDENGLHGYNRTKD